MLTLTDIERTFARLGDELEWVRTAMLSRDLLSESDEPLEPGRQALRAQLVRLLGYGIEGAHAFADRTREVRELAQGLGVFAREAFEGLASEEPPPFRRTFHDQSWLRRLYPDWPTASPANAPPLVSRACRWCGNRTGSEARTCRALRCTLRTAALAKRLERAAGKEKTA